MAQDDEILVLLREIRDLQKEHLETYRSQSQRVIAMNKVGLKRQLVPIVLVVVIFAFTAWYSASNSDVSQWKAIQDRKQQQLDQYDKQMQWYMDATRRKGPNDASK